MTGKEDSYRAAAIRYSFLKSWNWTLFNNNNQYSILFYMLLFNWISVWDMLLHLWILFWSSLLVRTQNSKTECEMLYDVILGLCAPSRTRQCCSRLSGTWSKPSSIACPPSPRRRSSQACTSLELEILPKLREEVKLTKFVVASDIFNVFD